MDDLLELAFRLHSTSVGQSILDLVVVPNAIATAANVSCHSDSFLATSHDGFCCLLHCNLTHQIGKLLRSYQALTVESRLCQNMDFLMRVFTRMIR